MKFETIAPRSGKVPAAKREGRMGNYAGLPGHAEHALVEKYMRGRASGTLTCRWGAAAR